MPGITPVFPSSLPYFDLSQGQPVRGQCIAGAENSLQNYGISLTHVSIDDNIVNDVIGIIKSAEKTSSFKITGDDANFDLEAEIKKHHDSLFVKCFAIKADEVNDNGELGSLTTGDKVSEYIEFLSIGDFNKSL